MKKNSFILILLICCCISINSQINYSDYFTDARMRVDLVFAGDHENMNIYLEKIKGEPEWGGTRTNLVDPLQLGEFQYRVLDTPTGELIFSRGFSTLFEEWQTTREAETTQKYLTEVLVFPYPKNEIILELYRRDQQNNFEKCFELDIDPADLYIEQGIKYDFEIRKYIDSGDPARHVDLLFLAEGYTAGQVDDFYNDVERFSGYLFAMEPYKSNKEKFNIWTIAAISAEEGTDIPGEGIWKNTILNTNFYTFGLARYLTTYDYKTVCDVVAPVPYDQIFVLVNIDRYGGGGMYNNYCVGSNGGRAPGEVMVHEFGHGFAGLGDEYYSSAVAYEEYFDLSVEPWEPNLTTLVDFESKWSDMLEPGTPVPTPAVEPYLDKTGVFEGGGYVAKGVYRPAIDCRMKSNEAEGFCEVCKRAIVRMIQYYTE
ncbi:MAG: hypothetical protein AMS27_02515 [Bacteroides sp. SM23_62_1]|nr:MAG: hypothetical protein AMS27_02515 [Bacteroides sp. SM23_62_1]